MDILHFLSSYNMVNMTFFVVQPDLFFEEELVHDE